MYEAIPTPAVVIELEQAEENLRQMAKQAAAHGLVLRPHIKPHKSVYFARQQLQFGARGITCATLHEAEIMAEQGIDDILIAYPLIGADKLERLGRLLKKAKVLTLVNSQYGAEGLSDLGHRLGTQIPVLIEVDGGLYRGGLAPYEPTLNFAKQIASLNGIAICGLLYYGGLIYAKTSKSGFEAEARREHDALTQTAQLLREHGFSMQILSGGNSYSSRFCKQLEGITELRCGNYIFNDVLTLTTGFATEEQCALRAISTVVCVVDEYHAILDAGSKTLSTDLCAFRRGYGYVVGRPDLVIAKLNEEHGFLESEVPHNLHVGDKLAIIPNHACVLPNLTDRVYGIRAGQVERMIPVDARTTCL